MSSKESHSEFPVAILECDLPAVSVDSVSMREGTSKLVDTSFSMPLGILKSYPLHNGKMFRIGRVPTNDLVVEHQSVSRFHALLSPSKSGVVLSDLSSLNGTWVNERLISTPVSLNSGDIIKIGPLKITFQLHHQQMEDEFLEELQTRATEMRAVMTTVLVASVTDYTKFSATLPDTEVAKMLNIWFDLVSKKIEETSGRVDKFLASGVMALWYGEADSVTAQAQNAFLAAKSILAATKDLAASGEWGYQADFPWMCRLALHTGEALVGAIGRAGKTEFTALGDSVNIAFRLEDVARERRVPLILSGSTAEHLISKVELSEIGEVAISGRSQGVAAYELSN